MGTHQPAHAGQLLTSQGGSDSPPREHHCSFCGTPIAPDTDDYVDHCLATDSGEDERHERYCSPSCFIREIQHVGGIGTAE